MLTYAHQRMRRPPKQRNQHNGFPEVGVRSRVNVDAKPPWLTTSFRKRKGRTRQASGQAIPCQIHPPPTFPRPAFVGFGRIKLNCQNAQISDCPTKCSFAASANMLNDANFKEPASGMEESGIKVEVHFFHWHVPLSSHVEFRMRMSNRPACVPPNT